MDEAPIIFLGILILVWLVVGPIIALVIASRQKRRSKELQESLRELTSRIYELEVQLGRLRAGEHEQAAATAPITIPAGDAVVSTTQPKPTPQVTVPSVPSAQTLKQQADRPAASVVPQAVQTPAATAPPSRVSAASPSASASASAGAKAKAEQRRFANLEERVGANWLNKIGTALLVLGIAYFLNYTLRQLGPVGKIATGYGVALALLVLGVVGETRERYRVAARAILGGGWAIIYFTTYAMHNVQAVRVIESERLGFFLLFVAAAAMVAHSLRYNSQLATGFAYFLAFASIAISRIGIEAMFASCLLTASIALLLWRRKWYALEPPAIAAAYLVHFAWLRQIFAERGHHPFPEFNASAILLTLYWAVWVASYFARKDKEDKQRILLTCSALLNIGSYLAVMRYQSFYPELRFWFLLGIGAIYLVLAPLARRIQRRDAFILTTTIGAVLAATAVPFRYSGGRLEVLWLLEAEAFLVAGWRSGEAHLRRLGWAASAALTVYLVGWPIAERLQNWRPPDTRLGWQFAAIGIAFLLNARFAAPLLGKSAEELDLWGSDASYAVATGLLLSAAWFALPLMWVAMVWVVIAVALGEWGRLIGSRELRMCEHSAALLGVGRLLFINLPRAQDFHGISLRLLTVGVAAALMFIEARRLRASFPALEQADDEASKARSRAAWFGGVPAAYSWSAALLATLIIWKETTDMAVGLAWGMLGLVLVEAGRALKDRPVVLQGKVLLTLSLVRVFTADLNSTSRLGAFSARFVTVSLLAAIYYYVAFSSGSDQSAIDARGMAAASRQRSIFLWYGAAAVIALVRFEADPSWVAVGWAVFVVALYVLGRVLNIVALRYQAYFLTLLVGVRCAFDNFYQVGPWRFTSIRVVTVAAVSFLLYLLLGWALLERRRAPILRPTSEAADD